MVIKRGSAGDFFRSLYQDFLRQSAEAVPALAEHGLAERMDAIGGQWIDFALVLKEQSERETCDPALFEEAGRRMAQLADLEDALFADLDELARRDAVWAA